MAGEGRCAGKSPIHKPPSPFPLPKGEGYEAASIRVARFDCLGAKIRSSGRGSAAVVRVAEVDVAVLHQTARFKIDILEGHGIANHGAIVIGIRLGQSPF